MTTETSQSTESLQFRKRYRTLADDDLVRLALDENLLTSAREAMTDELEARGIQDLSSFKKRFEEDAAIVRAGRVRPLFPSSELQADPENGQYLGFTGLVIIGLIGGHKWLLGDATTWRKEGTLFLFLFFALVFTWDPIRDVLKRRASGKLIFWLILGLFYVAAIATSLAVPAVDRYVATLNPLVVLVLITSPAIVQFGRKAAARLANRSP